MRPFALVAVWLGVLAALIWWYLNAEGPQLSGREIGRAMAVAGRVEYRLEQIALWSDVRRGQSLVDGSVLSTGNDGRAEVRLESGKVLELGAETQIILSSASDARRSDFVVNVVVGNLKVKNDVAPPAPIVRNFASLGLRAIGQGSGTQIRVGGKVIDIPDSSAPAAGGTSSEESGARLLDLSRSEDGKVEVKADARSNLMVRDEASGTSEAVVGVWRPTPAPTPSADTAQAAPEPPKVDAKWADAKLAEDVLSKAALSAEWAANVLWHPASLRQGRAEPLPVEFALPPGTADSLLDKALLVRVKSRGAVVTKQGALEGAALKFTLAADDFRVLLAGAGGGPPVGVHPLTFELGVKGDSDPQWSSVIHAATLASATDSAMPRMRVLLGEATWTAVRATFDGAAPRPAPRWFWQGPRTSAATRDGARKAEVPWKVSLDFADALAGPRFVALLRNGAEFAIEAAPNSLPPDRTALRFVRGSKERLVMLGREDDLVREAGSRVVDGLLAWSDAKLAYLGREGQALDKASFLGRLAEASMGGAREWDWMKRGKGFGAVFPGGAKPVFVEWGIATKHPGFARSFLGKAEAFVPVDGPRGLRVRATDGAGAGGLDGVDGDGTGGEGDPGGTLP